jgi:hypothetical protein
VFKGLRIQFKDSVISVVVRGDTLDKIEMCNVIRLFRFLTAAPHFGKLDGSTSFKLSS